VGAFRPLQNRVTPLSEIVATAARGMFTGNRGIIHDPATRTLLRRRWSSKAWIVCNCEYKGIRRDVWARHSWTELFFLDEATALAAGHRPCFTCRRDAAIAFRDAWTIGNRVAAPLAVEMDAVLHRERLNGRAKRLHPMPRALPDGTMIAAGGGPFLMLGGKAYRWSFEGYEVVETPPPPDGLLTPPSTVAALSAGYRPVLHRSTHQRMIDSDLHPGEDQDRRQHGEHRQDERDPQPAAESAKHQRRQRAEGERDRRKQGYTLPD
jgi:hypothetical protein